MSQQTKTMEERSVIHSTFVIERSYTATPERVFAAFADPAKKRRWYAGDRGLAVEEYELDFRVGGREHARYRFQEGSPFPGTALVNETIYQDIVPNQRIVIAYTMTLGDKRISASLATFELLPRNQGTDLVFTEQGAYFEGADGPKMREDGWRKLLDKLAEELTRQSR
jgi:uncharacterized protein YndB with AHSA1/START domain